MLTDLVTLGWLVPEMLLIAVATLIVVGGTVRRDGRLWLGVSLTGYLGAALVILLWEGRHWSGDLSAAVTGPLVVDVLGHMMRLLMLGAGAVLSLMLVRQPEQRLQTEILGLMMFAVLGAMLVARANELVVLFVALEMVSIPTYALLYVGGRGRDSGESAAKYFYLSILSSAVLLYGLSFVYGATGTTLLVSGNQLDALSIRDAVGGGGVAGMLGLAFVVAGLGFKIAAAPFHFYAPDVYQGTSSTNAAILSIVPKVAGFAALTRLVVVALGDLGEFAWQLTLVLAVLTMTIGNVCALWQDNIRRMMAYSSIAHAGYMLIGVAVASTAIRERLSVGGSEAMLYYLFVYALATAGFFAVLAHLSRGDRSVDSVQQLSGLASHHPLLAGMVAICMFSLAGLPPLAGFWGKLLLFTSALGVGVNADSPLSWWFLTLAVVGALNAAVAAAYYLRIISAMYFRPAAGEVLEYRGASPAGIAAGSCAVLVLLLGLWQAPLAEWSGRAERSLQSALTPAATTTPVAAAQASAGPEIELAR